MSRMIRLAVLASLSLPQACSDNSIPGPRDPVATVVVEPAARDVNVGDVFQLTAIPRDKNNGALQGRTVTWSSSDTSVATVASTGRVTAHAPGIVFISAASEGRTGVASLYVTWSAAPVASVTLNRITLTLLEGDSTRLVATLRDAAGRLLSGRTRAWTSSAPSVASVTSAGLVRALRPQSAVIAVTAEGKTAEAVVNVSAQHAFDLVYSGSASAVGVSRLYLLRLDGTPQLLLPANALPAWNLVSAAGSPNGQHIAFAAQLAGESHVHVVNADGTNLRQLTNDGRAGQPTWSPDGTKLAYFNSGDIWVMNSDGSNQVNLTGEIGLTDRHSPAWSPAMPGGSRIAFSEGDHMRRRIMTMRPDGSDVRAVTASGDWIDSEPAWSPNGAHIVFTRESTLGGTDIWVVEANGTNLRPLVSLHGVQANPAWSPDGRLIAFSSAHEPGSLFDVYTVWPDGANIVRRTGPAFGVHPAWRSRP